MSIRPSDLVTPRPDNSQAVAGSNGSVIVQAEDGTLGTREFPGEDTDIEFEQDITEDDVVGEFKDVGATQQLAGAVQSEDDKAFSVRIEWTDDLGNVRWTESGLDDIDEDDDYGVEIDAVPVRYNRGQIRVVDESDSVEHEVSGIFNFA